MVGRKSLMLSGAVVALFAPTVFALEVQSSVASYVSFRNCIPIRSTCDYFEMSALGTYGGEPGALEAVASQAIPGYGESYASGSLSGEAGTPVLRARATSEMGARVSANAFALQRFTYTGNESTQRTLQGTLTYSLDVSNPEDAASIGESVVNASIYIFKLDGSFVEAGSTAEQNFTALFQLNWLPPLGYQLLASDRSRVGTTTSAGEATLAATVNLEPGDAVWALVAIQTPVANGSVVDASRTLMTSWNDSTDIIPANVSPGIPGELLASLFESSTGVGPGSSLADKMAIAQAYYAARDISGTCAMLHDYQNHIRAVSGRRLQPDVGRQLSADAQRIELAIGCE